ncbi:MULTISPECIES: ABC transporter ATP-binding protein [Rossellomorea]|jgi:ABC-2 type transport system ATP-binding protein|uniref:ABC transporter ATP-binding protein n=1 Tax=Rossellomorea TaxID=2837508 RepID=UPI0011E95076|nr:MULTISPECIES: ABC transporter ATP-binding protein [Rossellomorea]MDT9027601.1 ABC transporter ATP-binding protein [Rossellomorea sp. YC4-1]TYS90357.1 ABC transporter ATP-binding protein [Rossellomorea aquimaris]
MIEIKSLSKSFEGTKIIHDVSFSVQKGSIYGLLGSNGAGKTTLLKSISGVLKPESGDIYLKDQPVFENVPTKETLVFIPDQPFFFAHYTLNQMAKFYQNSYSRWDEHQYKSLTGLFGVDPHKKLHKFSKGVQRQAAFILALSTQPDVLIMDEPLDGLDPVVRKKVKSVLITEVANREMTLLISSHNLREVEDICDHIGILHQGRFLLEKELDDLKSGIHKIQLAFKGEMPQKIFTELDLLHEETRGSVSLCIVRGDEQHVRSMIQPYHPVIFDMLPLTLEEIFVYEMEDVGYAIQNIMDQ